MSKLTQNQQAISAAVYAAASVAFDDNGQTKPLTADVYNGTLPEGITPDIATAVAKHNIDWVVGSVDGVGRASVENQTKHTGISENTFVLPMAHHDTLSITTQREVKTGEGDNATSKFGVVTATLDIQAARAGAGLNAAMKGIAKMAATAYGNDN